MNMLSEVLRIVRDPKMDRRPVVIAKKLGITEEQIMVLLDRLSELGHLDRVDDQLTQCPDLQTAGCSGCPIANGCSSSAKIKPLFRIKSMEKQ